MEYPKEVIYPHYSRHRLAKNFLDRFNDIALLADLMGHESIETTRIYFRRTASEQREIVEKSLIGKIYPCRLMLAGIFQSYPNERRGP